MTTYLLDINLLLALIDPMHIHPDVYLTGLVVHKKGKLATLDQHIPVHAIRVGDDALELINV
jgi:hypothetical protein